MEVLFLSERHSTAVNRNFLVQRSIVRYVRSNRERHWLRLQRTLKFNPCDVIQHVSAMFEAGDGELGDTDLCPLELRLGMLFVFMT